MFRKSSNVDCEEISFEIVKEARNQTDGALMLESVEILGSFIAHADRSEIPRMALLQLNDAESRVAIMSINRGNSVIRPSISRHLSMRHAIDVWNIRYKTFERCVRNGCVEYSEILAGAMALLFSHLREIP